MAALVAEDEERRRTEQATMRKEDWRSRVLRSFGMTNKKPAMDAAAGATVAQKTQQVCFLSATQKIRFDFRCSQRSAGAKAEVDKIKKKFSEEDVLKSRLAIQRRVAARLEREKNIIREQEKDTEERRLQQEKVCAAGNVLIFYSKFIFLLLVCRFCWKQSLGCKRVCA